MSTSINLGIQDLSFQYREEARAKYFNKIIDQLLPAGIYAGGALRVNGTVQVILEPIICLIKPGNITTTDIDISVRVETTVDQTISMAQTLDPTQPDTTKPYIVLRFDWADQENNYMDMLAVAFSDDPEEADDDFIKPNDLVVGKVLFEDDGLGGYRIVTVEANAFDYTRRDEAFIPDSTAAFNELRVQSSENDPSNKVFVTQGTINTSQGRQDITGGDYPTASNISPTTTLPRIDIVYVDENGDVLVEEGVPAASPEAPSYQNRKVIGEISREANRTDISGIDIRQVNVTRQGTIAAADFPIIDSGAYFVGNQNIEDAFQQVGQEVYDNIYGSGNPDWIKDFHIDWGTGADQVSAGDIPIEDALGLLTATEVESALAEIMQAANTNASNLSAHEALEADTTTVHGIDIVTEIT